MLITKGRRSFKISFLRKFDDKKSVINRLRDMTLVTGLKRKYFMSVKNFIFGIFFH